MPDRGKHGNVSRTVRKGAGLRQIDAFSLSVVPNASGLFVFGEKRRQNIAGGNVISELQTIADHFIDAEVQRDWTNCKIQCAGDQNVSITELARAIDNGFRLWKNRRFKRDFK